jgi:hypothetical protein
MGRIQTLKTGRVLCTLTTAIRLREDVIDYFAGLRYEITPRPLMTASSDCFARDLAFHYNAWQKASELLGLRTDSVPNGKRSVSAFPHRRQPIISNRHYVIKMFFR